MLLLLLLVTVALQLLVYKLEKALAWKIDRNVKELCLFISFFNSNMKLIDVIFIILYLDLSNW